MMQLSLSDPIPADADDLAVGIIPSGIAFINNRVVTMTDASQVMCPPGWDILFDGTIVMIVQTDSEVLNA